ncbi:hypothetical protein HX109_03605 [Galbibacter sp. BG1]|uniref:hypothetical protein n=1 Tax=Galbibacter sp. BG1 TaxID=1170699 RepID=UPI0015BD7ABE|nr:hypothetical protein [Galbibacter sp. BG1]QLE00691.1 hypothetical protein HX109_03605 [Galbibacter sp. BG1]
MKKLLLPLLACFFTVFASAQEEENAAANSAAQANNPLANMTALNFHDYYTPKLSNAPDDAYLNTAWVRFAKPFSSGKLLLRVSTPLSTIGTPDVNGNVNTVNGLGDINAFMSYNFVSKPSATVGAGPLLTAPTASNELLGTGKWQAGFAFVAFIAKSPVFQFGSLVTWQTSIAGQSDRESTNNAAFQPFYFWQLGKGLYLRGAPIWYFDIKNDAYSVPMGLGVGKVIKVGDTMINCFIEPQYSMLTYGTQPLFQVFTGINLQFMN